MQEQQSISLWGKLIPLSKGLNTFALRDSKIMIGRSENKCKIMIAQKRLSSQHCLIEKEGEEVFVTDLSTNGTYLNTEKIGKNNKVPINQGDELWLLPICRVSQEETIGFKISYVGWSAKKKEEFINSVKEQITCPYCRQIMIYPVIAQPCNHRFCGPCLTLLVNKKKGQCIICRKELLTAARDTGFSSIIDDYLRTHPQEKRNDEDELPNIFGFTPTNIRPIIYGIEEEEIKPPQTSQTQQKKVEVVPQKMENEKQENRGIDLQKLGDQLQNAFQVRFDDEPEQKRGRGGRNQQKSRGRLKKAKKFISSDISASTDSQNDRQPSKVCLQCVQARNGFMCDPNQPHISCHNCNKPMPIRQEERLNQRCAICRSYFCNLYLPPCQKNGPKLGVLGRRGESCKIQPVYFRNNRVEMDAFKNLLISQKTTLKDMFHDMLGLAESGRFQFMINKKISRNPPVQQKMIRLNKHSPICDNCWRELWFQMIFMFVRENSYLMPDTIKNRPVCYWGINCRTMQHNIEHAKRFSHMQFQTKF